MSIRQDYILRMFQDMTIFMTRVVQMRKEQRDEDALLLLVDESAKITGIPPSLIYALSDEDLIQTLQARGALEAMRCYVLAELFREEGSIYADRGEQQEALLRLSKGARLYAEALSRSDDDDALPSLVGARSLLAVVHAADLPFATAAMLVDELLRYEQFELVDNLLFELQDARDDPQMVRLVTDGYAAMLQATDDQLIDAGLARDEIALALAQASAANTTPTT
jgi:hypothetical protein